MHVYLGTPGFEPALRAELGSGAALAPGVVASDARLDPVFARQILPDAAQLRGASVRALAEAAYEVVEPVVDRWPGPFTLHALTPPGDPEVGLGSRAALIGRTLLDLLAERRRRASRRYQLPEAATAAFDPGWLLVELLALGRDRLLVSAASPRPLPHGGTDLSPWPAGAAPVAIDRAPPSRAYQKLEEAWQWMGLAPAPGALCVDLGAAPGGWTMTVLKRGARVIAVDRAPLDVEHRDLATVIGNAFTYAPAGTVDWLLSDVVCEPARSLALIDRWMTAGWCRNLVVTVKFKGGGGYGALAALPPLYDRLHPAFARTKQLGYNKNEVTVMIVSGESPATGTGGRPT